jgi:hypothetical protein
MQCLFLKCIVAAASISCKGEMNGVPNVCEILICFFSLSMAVEF